MLNCGIGANPCLGGLVIPYRDLEGKVNGFARVRPHMARKGKNGKPIKYEQPKGEPLRAYFPAASLEQLRDGESQIFITEGEKKALALAQVGAAAIGIGGVDCGMKDGALIPDLAAIDWTGRNVAIVFDYDEKPITRQNVAGAMRRLAKALKAVGAQEVYSVPLPPGPEGSKQGIDDCLAAAGDEAGNRLDELIAQARPVLQQRIEAGGTSVIKIIPVAPPELGEAAYLGVVGDFLRAVAPYTEATDAGVLAHLLPAVGTLIGSGLHIFSGGKQPARLNAAVVGPTNSGRKGTSAVPVDLLMNLVDRGFWSRQRVSGMSSGEGLIAYVADVEKKDDDGNPVTVAVEKRLFVLEEELSRVLAQIRREGNILSQIVRSAYDSGNLSTLTVNPRHASGAHISIVGHITPEELAERLDHVEMANGFGNRFLWFLVKSDKIMPRTEPIPHAIFLPFAARLGMLHALGAEGKDCPVQLDAAASELWESLYPVLREDRPGLAGAMVARGPVMVLRIALIYAALGAKFVRGEMPDLSIGVEHLEAARAIWDYCQDSAEILFHSETGDKFCDKLLQLLANGPMTKDEFNRHLSAKQKAEVGKALAKLELLKMVQKVEVKHEGAGRPATRWERLV